MSEELPECPMPRVACIDCQGADDTLKCIWHYKKTYREPVISPGKDKEYTTEW